jgi:hypothetical protein
MEPNIKAYNQGTLLYETLCSLLAQIIAAELTEAEAKIWHAHPVWFINGNPIVGYSKQKAGIRLMFWSGADFKVEQLNVRGKKFKDASVYYSDINEVDKTEITAWLRLSRTIQWDYKNIVKRKGKLERIK